MAKAKICYIGPIHQHMYRWIDAFHNRRYDTSLITDSSCWVAPKIGFAPVYALPTLTKGNAVWLRFQNVLMTLRILKRLRPDIVNLHVQHYLSLAVILKRLPYVLTSWGIEIITLPKVNFFFRNWAKLTAMKATMITVDANFLKDIWVKNGIPRDKVRVIPFGVDTDIFRPRTGKSNIRDKLQIEKNDIVVISTRPFVNHHYDVERLIRTIPAVVEKHPNAKFILKGTGPLEVYLRDLARKLKVDDYTRFVGVVPHEEVAQYLSAADVYVSTCSFDSTSVSLLEAMACGLAPVVTDNLGNREWIRNEENGLLFPPGDHEKLAEKIKQLIENDSLRDVFGHRCLETVREKADWKNNVAEMETIYKALL